MKELKLSDIDNLVDKYVTHQHKETIISDVHSMKLEIIALINEFKNEQPKLPIKVVEYTGAEPTCSCSCFEMTWGSSV